MSVPALSVAVISDTHDAVPPQLPGLLKAADEIWHLGDVTDLSILAPIEALGIPLIGVEGNCDVPGIWPKQRLVERHGSVFQLQHRPPRQLATNANAILFGHLHYPIDQIEGRVRLLNPGAINGPRQGSAPSFAWLKFHDNGNWSWELQTL